jgi:hypothetical protein
MNRTYKKHMAAISNGIVDRENIIGIRKGINAMERRANGWSTSCTAPKWTFDEWDSLEDAIAQHRPRVVGVLHLSGLAILNSPRYAKRLQCQQSFIARIDHFRLCEFARIGARGDHCVPVYEACDSSDSVMFRFQVVPWQSGGDGPEIVRSC